MITILVGKSASGKDYTKNKLVEQGYIPIVSWTTRPMREKEINGREYNFCNEKEFRYMIENGYILEWREYNVWNNGKRDKWYYGNGKIEIDNGLEYVVILDVEGCKKFIEWYGENCG